MVSSTQLHFPSELIHLHFMRLEPPSGRLTARPGPVHCRVVSDGGSGGVVWSLRIFPILVTWWAFQLRKPTLPSRTWGHPALFSMTWSQVLSYEVEMALGGVALGRLPSIFPPVKREQVHLPLWAVGDYHGVTVTAYILVPDT